MNAQDILKNKGYAVETTTEDVEVIEIIRHLADKRVGCLLVMGQDAKLLGLISERDIVNNLAKHGAEVLAWPASKIMSRNLIVGDPQSDSDSIMAWMTENRVRHLPIMDGNTLVGLVSIGDVVKQRIDELETESRYMREYIATAG